MSDTGLRPSQHAFSFGNSAGGFPVFQVVGTLDPLNIGENTGGLCGGMAAAAADCFAHGLPRPRQNSFLSDPNDTLLQLLIARQVESVITGLNFLQYVRLMSTRLTDEQKVHLTRTSEWPAVRADLESGRPCPLGLIMVRSDDWKDLGRNHQVLACAYTQSGSQVRMSVYDSNYPNRDDIVIEFDEDSDAVKLSCPQHPDLWAFFRVPYQPRMPPHLELELINSLDVAATVRFFNPGDPVHLAHRTAVNRSTLPLVWGR